MVRKWRAMEITTPLLGGEGVGLRLCTFGPQMRRKRCSEDVHLEQVGNNGTPTEQLDGYTKSEGF